METPPGSLLKANNTIINREGVIESRRGIKAYNSAENLLPTKTKQMFEYKGRILSHLQNNMLVYDNGSAVFVPFSGTYQEPVSGYRMRSAESKGNFYFTTKNGVRRISAKTAADLSAVDAIQQAGIPKGIAGYTVIDYTVSGFLTNGYKAGYIVIWTYTDKQGTKMQGAPSAPMIAENRSIVPDNSAVRVNFQIPYGITSDNYTSYKFTLYRSENVLRANTVPNEYRQIYERSPSISEIQSVSRQISYTDSISESLRIGGVPAYTNSASGFGLLQGNETPPSARDISLFNGSMFYANTRTTHSATVNLLSTTGFSSGVSNLVISNGDTTNSYTFQGQKRITEISVSQGTTLANIKNGEYFTLSSAGNERKYTVWMDKSGTGAVGQTTSVTVASLPTGSAKEVTSVTVNATLPTGSAKEVTSVTVNNTPTASSYLILNSARNQRKYVIWFDRSGTDAQPTISDTFSYVKVLIPASPAPTNISVAQLIRTAITSSMSSDFTVTAALTNIVTITNVEAGDVTDATSSTTPVSNLAVSVTTQGRESSYFVLNSAFDTRKYVVWFNRSGTDREPFVSGTFIYVPINTGAAPTAITIAGLINTAINNTPYIKDDFVSTNTAGTAVVTITNKDFGTVTNSTQSTTPTANLTITTPTQGGVSSYFILYSALNQRKYVVWFDRSGADLQPSVVDTYGYVKVNTGIAPSTTSVANSIYLQLIADAGADFTPSVSGAVVTIANKATGFSDDAFQSTTPTANLTITTTIQGTGPLPGTIPLQVNLPSSLTTPALIANAIQSAIQSSLSFDFTVGYTAGSTTFTVSTENNGFSDASSTYTPETSAAEVRTVTVGATLPAASSYFTIYSGNHRQYVVWFDRSGIDIQPTVSGTYGYIRVLVPISPAPTSISIAGLINTAINTNASSDFTSTNTTGTAVVTITNTQPNLAADSTQSTSPAASLTILTTTQGTGSWVLANAIQSGVGEDLPNKKILISGKQDLVAAIEDMANSIVRAINYNANETVVAYYASTANSTPGKIVLQSKNLQDVNFFVGTSDAYIAPKFLPELGTIVTNTSAESDSITSTDPLCLVNTSTSFSFIPGDTVLIYGATSTITSTTPSLNGKKTVYQISSLSDQYTIQQDVGEVTNAGYTMTAKMMSAVEAIGNRIYYAKYQEPEAVPILNYQDVGSKDQEILRIIPLRDGLYIFKNDGIFRLTGSDGNFQVGVYDNTAILKAPDTVVTLGNMCYFYGNQGIVKMGDAGMDSISRPIEDKVIPFLKSNPNLSTAAFAVAYESDRALLLWTVKSKLDTVATVCLRYNTYTQTWTEWEVPKLCAVLNSHEDTMYFGSAVDNYIEVERKNFDRFDYADRELDATMGDGALIGDSLYLASSTFALLSVGDVFSQTQYVSIPQFNSLLKKLDLDPGILATNFYSDVKLEVGGDLNARMVDLVAKLNTVDTWSGADTNGNTSYVFVPNYIDYSNVQVQFNKIVDRLNQSPNALHDNYLYSEGTKVYECYITELEVSTKKISLSIAPAFMVGPLKIYKGIPVEIQYSPQHGTDPESFKQFSDASFLFERRSFYSGQIAFNSDISDNFEEIPLFPYSSGIFGGATWGDGSTWGGLGDQANMRSYIPLKKQRCRFLGCKFIHVVALENFQLYGVSLSYRPYSISNRDYK